MSPIINTLLADNVPTHLRQRLAPRNATLPLVQGLVQKSIQDATRVKNHSYRNPYQDIKTFLTQVYGVIDLGGTVYIGIDFDTANQQVSVNAIDSNLQISKKATFPYLHGKTLEECTVDFFSGYTKVGNNSPQKNKAIVNTVDSTLLRVANILRNVTFSITPAAYIKLDESELLHKLRNDHEIFFLNENTAGINQGYLEHERIFTLDEPLGLQEFETIATSSFTGDDSQKRITFFAVHTASLRNPQGFLGTDIRRFTIDYTSYRQVLDSTDPNDHPPLSVVRNMKP